MFFKVTKRMKKRERIFFIQVKKKKLSSNETRITLDFNPGRDKEKCFDKVVTSTCLFHISFRLIHTRTHSIQWIIFMHTSEFLWRASTAASCWAEHFIDILDWIWKKKNNWDFLFSFVAVALGTYDRSSVWLFWKSILCETWKYSVIVGRRILPEENE